MTVIAWDGKTLAADRMGTYGNTRTTLTKIRRVGELLVGGAGTACYVQEMMEWIENGMQADAFPPAQRVADTMSPMIVITPSGMIHVFENTPYPVVREDKFTAIGSGRDFAIASMHLGLTAEQAVEVACKFDTGCGCGIDTLTLGVSTR